MLSGNEEPHGQPKVNFSKCFHYLLTADPVVVLTFNLLLSAGELLQALWKYQIATETWSVLPASQNVPIPIHLPYAFNVNNIIILINGLENYVDNLKVFSYDPRQSNPTWVEEATQQSIACPKGLATRHEVLIAARV